MNKETSAQAALETAALSIPVKSYTLRLALSICLAVLVG